MKQIKIYRKVHERNKILGLEFPEFLLLVLIYLFVFLFSKNIFVNAAVVIGSYFFLHAYKRGKPSHWTSSVLRFLLTTRHYSNVRERNKDIFDETH